MKNKYRIKQVEYTRAFSCATSRFKYVPQKKFLLWWFDMTESYAPDGMQFGVSFKSYKEAQQYISDDIGDIIIEEQIYTKI